MLPTRHSHDVGQLLAAHSVGPVPSGLQRTESSIERIMERPVPVHFSEYSKPQAGSVRSRRYGAKFQNGFAAFLQSQELSDVIIVAPDGKEYKAHMLLLAYHSEFFQRAFTSSFREKEERKVTLGFEDPAGVWPTLLQYFYTDEVQLTDETVLPLLAMARELMVKSIEDFCADYAQNSLEASNAIQYLNQAVQFNCDSFRESCVALVAEGFPSSFNKPTDGLPTEVMLEVLQHPHLVVQTEEQVLTFVLTYVRRHSLPPATVRQLFEHVRFPFLSNDKLAALMQEDCVPRDLLLSAMALRLSLLDHPEKLLPPTLPLVLQQQQAMQYGLHLSLAGSPTGPGSGAYGQGPLGALGASSAPQVVHSGTQSCVGPLPSPTASQADSGPLSTGGERGPVAAAAAAEGPASNGSGSSATVVPPCLCAAPRRTYICTLEYGLPGGSEYASVPLHEVWEDLVPQLRVRVSGDVVEGDPESILRVHDQDSAWFAVSGEAGAGPGLGGMGPGGGMGGGGGGGMGGANGPQPVWIEVEFPPNMRVVELAKYTFSHGMNFATHMFPYGISDSAWFQMKGLITQVSGGDGEPYHLLRTSESSALQFEYTVTVEGGAGMGSGAATGNGAGGTGGSNQARMLPWRRLRISCSEEQAGGSVRLSIRKLRLFGRLEISLTREGVAGAKDLLAAWRRKKEAASIRQAMRRTQSVAHMI